MRARGIIRIFTILVTMLPATSSRAAFGELIQYVKQFQLGIDYSNSIDYVGLSYDTSSQGGFPDSCAVVVDDPTKKRCSVGMIGGASSGWGLFLERAFQKQGFFYFNWDISAGMRLLTGELPAADRSKSGLPLRNASFSLAAFVVKPYVQFGVTPDWWPDVFVTMGPALQVAGGNVTINDEVENVAVGTSSYSGPMSLINGFFALEIVLKRFGEGAFSLIASHDVTGHGEGSELFPREVDGMSNFRGTFSRNTSGQVYGFGLKLITPFP